MKYLILNAPSALKLTEKVNKYLLQNYEPLGGPLIYEDTWNQAVIYKGIQYRKEAI